MKRNRFMGLLALAITTLPLAQCKKEDKLPVVQDTVKENTAGAKAWLEGQRAALVKSGGAAQLADAGRIGWDSPIGGTDGHTAFFPVATDSKQLAKYLKINRAADGGITGGNYVYLYGTMQKQANAYLLEGKEIPTDFNGAILEYGLGNRLLASKVYEKGHAVAGKTAKLALKPAPDKLRGNTAAARTVCTAYYVETYMDGVLVSEVYLYTICVKEPDEALVTDDGSGGGGALDESAALMAQFNDHIKSRSTPAEATVPETTPQPDPISFTHDWVVVEGAIASWKVMATTRMDYYHKKYYDIQLNAIEHSYDIIYLKTANVQYVGSNTFVTTTWTTTSIIDNINSNNTSSAYGKSHVFGKLKHRANFNVPNPFNPSSPIVPDAETAPNNYCLTLAR